MSKLSNKMPERAMLVLSGMVLRWTVASPFLLDEKKLEDVGLRKKTKPVLILAGRPGPSYLTSLIPVSDLKNDNGNSYIPGL